MSAPKFSVLVEGVDSLSRALKLASPECHKRVAEVIKKNTETVKGGAEERVPRVSGELGSTIRAEYSADGLAGYVKAGYGTLERRAKGANMRQADRLLRGDRRLQLALANTSRQASTAVSPGVYAPVVEHGDDRRHHSRHPFMDPALEADKPTAIADINGALNGTIESIGSTV